MTEQQIAKHTPDPWESEDCGSYFKITDVQGVTVADIPKQPLDPPEWAEFNAHLIKSAPNGHKLIQRLWAFIENGSGSDDFFDIRCEVREYYDKAEGRL